MKEELTDAVSGTDYYSSGVETNEKNPAPPVEPPQVTPADPEGETTSQEPAPGSNPDQEAAEKPADG
jgi:hypothetical protein